MTGYKKLAVVVSAAFLFLAPSPAFAVDARHHSGGVYNETEYQEITFITGEPVLLKGTLRSNQRGGRGGQGGSISLKLENAEKNMELSRSISYTTVEEQKGKQTISVITVNSYSESIDVGDNSYELEDFQFSKSVITDDRPAVDYFSGNWNGRKIYEFNDGAGEAVVLIEGETVGYDNPWGSTETQRISGSISFEGDLSVGETVYDEDWSGTFTLDVTYNSIKDVRYEENLPTYISFSGGYVLVEEMNNSLSYSCRMPAMGENGIPRGGLRKYSDSIALQSNPSYKRLPVYSCRDMQGHWAEDDVRILYGLEVFSRGEYFGPSVPMTRAEFARALGRVLQLTVSSSGDAEAGVPVLNIPWLTGGQADEASGAETDFIDVPTDHPYYEDIEAVFENDLITGTGAGYFSPDGRLTRSQALTTFIRALGFEHLAPPFARTPYADDAAVPGWARDAVFVASEIGLVSGDAFGCINPNQVMTRAEAAVFLNRFIEYLRQDLRHEYRDKIFQFR